MPEIVLMKQNLENVGSSINVKLDVNYNTVASPLHSSYIAGFGYSGPWQGYSGRNRRVQTLHCKPRSQAVTFSSRSNFIYMQNVDNIINNTKQQYYSI